MLGAASDNGLHRLVPGMARRRRPRTGDAGQGAQLDADVSRLRDALCVIGEQRLRSSEAKFLRRRAIEVFLGGHDDGRPVARLLRPIQREAGATSSEESCETAASANSAYSCTSGVLEARCDFRMEPRRRRQDPETRSTALAESHSASQMPLHSTRRIARLLVQAALLSTAEASLLSKT